ncbi:oxidoreductase [Actinomyces radicidentis]|uniref:Oxidoreductase n=1 Tax=Actinomyces radicidentis TaxID=111015 RepID=A0A0X8JDM6_ACTRD|nr:SDR family NAD(P)-dependent oxidoreductase [Actinomyces radicidentis]AMD86488.1 oxidoreductase [Actinomyces radicidentis]
MALALVTGASAGIGFQLAFQLADRGYDVVGVGASARIHQLGERITGVEVLPVQADLTTAEGVEAVWEAVESLGRPLDVACLNAGRSLGGAFLDTDLDDELSMLALNVTGQVRLAKHVVRHMASKRAGRVLITTSCSALTPTPYESIYGPTRAFMLSFAEGLREEMKEHGVSVTALLPGATATEFHHTAGMDNTRFGSNDWKNDPAVVAEQGLEALFAGDDHVVGGDQATKDDAALNRTLSDPVKAAKFAEASRPRK